MALTSAGDADSADLEMARRCVEGQGVTEVSARSLENGLTFVSRQQPSRR